MRCQLQDSEEWRRERVSFGAPLNMQVAPWSCQWSVIRESWLRECCCLSHCAGTRVQAPQCWQPLSSHMSSWSCLCVHLCHLLRSMPLHSKILGIGYILAMMGTIWTLIIFHSQSYHLVTLLSSCVCTFWEASSYPSLSNLASTRKLIKVPIPRIVHQWMKSWSLRGRPRPEWVSWRCFLGKMVSVSSEIHRSTQRSLRRGRQSAQPHPFSQPHKHVTYFSSQEKDGGITEHPSPRSSCTSQDTRAGGLADTAVLPSQREKDFPSSTSWHLQRGW